MKTFKELIKEVAEPKAGDEKRFKDKHVVAKIDHPAAEEDQFTAKKMKKKKNEASYDEGEDQDVYEEVDLDEATATVKQKAALKALMSKALGGKRPKLGYTSAIATNGDFVVHDGGGRVVGRIAKGGFTDPLKEEVELDEGNMDSVAKELEAYARKNGGIDKGDFMKAAMMMKKGQKKQLMKFVDELDTEPREKILSLMHGMKEETMTDAEMKKREDIVKAMKDSKDEFKKRYGEKWKSVMYATATKQAMKEAVKLEEDISKMSHSRLKWHMNTGVPHGSYTKNEMMKERDRRLKTGEGEAYKKAKPTMNESVIVEGVLDDLRDIVKRKSMKEVKFADGSKTKVDMTTANAMVRVHDSLNPQNQKKFADAINKDQKMFMKMMDFAFNAGKK